MQSRNGNIPIANDESAAEQEPDDGRMWYARLKIRDDRLAKLWAWKLAEHDVIVWSESDERWKQLLAVPELRAAVRKATTSAFARKSTPPALPGSQMRAPDSSTRRRQLQNPAEFDGEELTTRVNRSSFYLDDMDMEPTTVAQARPMQQPVSSVPPPPPLELLRALTTTIPPAVHSAPALEFPRAPKVPSITELAKTTTIHPSSTSDQGSNSSSFLPPPTHSDFREIRPGLGATTQTAYSQSSPPAAISSRPPPPSALRRLQSNQLAARPQYVVARPASQFTIKNLSWALLPIACAGVFAIFLDRYLPHQTKSGPVTYIEAPSESGVGQLVPWVGAMLGMSLDGTQRTRPSQAEPSVVLPAPQAPVANLTPEQLAPVSASPKAFVGRGAGVAHAAVSKGPGAKVAAASNGRAEDKASATSANAGVTAPAAAATNDSFDRDGARTALKFAVARVRNCSNSGVTGSALITFGPSGTVQKVQLSQLVGDDVDAGCVSRALSSTRVPPFTGAPVTVRKAF